MFGMYPKPLVYKSPTVKFMCERLGRTLVAYMLNLRNREHVLIEEDSEAILLAYKLYTERFDDCGVGIAMIQFIAMGGYGEGVAISIRDGDYEQAEKSSQFWAGVECGRIDPMGW